MLEFDPLDEYPIHQVALPMRYIATSDRNVYDRCIYQGIDHEADDVLHHRARRVPEPRRHRRVRDGAPRRPAVGDPRVGRAAPTTSMSQQVGPYRIEVIEPFRELRIDLRRRRARPRLRPRVPLRVRADLRAAAHPPPGRPHPARRVALRGRRHVGGRAPRRRRNDRGHARAVHRDARPLVGHPAGRRARARGPAQRVHRHVVVLDPAALRRLRAARHPRGGPHRHAQHELRGARAGPTRPASPSSNSAGRCPRSRTRRARATRSHASIDLTTRDGKTSTLEIEPLIGIPLNVGCGYGADPDWTHGLWKGDDWVEGSVYDHNDPAVTGRAAFSLWDHVARATFDGQEGWGIFEHGVIGAPRPLRLHRLRRRRP